MNASDTPDNNDHELPETDDLKLNITFASTTDLIDELANRYEDLVVIWYETDKLKENEFDRREYGSKNGAGYLRYDTRGYSSTVIGMMERLKHSILND